MWPDSQAVFPAIWGLDRRVFLNSFCAKALCSFARRLRCSISALVRIAETVVTSDSGAVVGMWMDECGRGAVGVDILMLLTPPARVN
jgi:hypothetical protein